MRKTALGGVLSLLTLVLTAAAGNSQGPIRLGGQHAVPEPLLVADGVYEVTLSIRTELMGGELLWEQSYPKVPIRNGSIETLFIGPPDDVDISGSWLEILVDGQLVSGPTEINANETSASLEFSPWGLTFRGFDQWDNPGEASIDLIPYPFSSNIFYLWLENRDGPISLDGEELEVHSVASFWDQVILWSGSNATLEPATGYLMIGGAGYEQNLVLDDNEIQARNNGVASTLYLQHQGGQVRINNVPILTSDRRKKEEIRDLKLGLNEVMQLRPVSFEWKDQPGPRRPGLVGQEVREVIEEIVSEDDDGTLGLAYGSLIPVLVRSIQEQQVEIEQLRADLEALRVQVSGG